MRRRIEATAPDILEQDGYERAEHGDLLLLVTVGARETSAYPPLPPPRVAPDRSSGWAIAPEGVDVFQGAVVVELYDAATSAVVWHGAARAEIDPGKVDMQRLDRIVAAAFAGFPRR